MLAGTKRACDGCLRAAVAVAACVAGCTAVRNAVEAPSVTYRAFEIDSIAFDGVAAHILFDVRNPNSFSVPVAGYRYAIRVGTVQIAEDTSGVQFDIPGAGTTEISVPISVQFSDLIRAASELDGRETWPYSVEGELTIGSGSLMGVSVQFSHASEMQRPLAPEISIARVRARSASSDSTSSSSDSG